MIWNQLAGAHTTVEVAEALVGESYAADVVPRPAAARATLIVAFYKNLHTTNDLVPIASSGPQMALGRWRRCREGPLLVITRPLLQRRWSLHERS